MAHNSSRSFANAIKASNIRVTSRRLLYMRGSRFAFLFLTTSSRFFMTADSLASITASSSSSPRRRSFTTTSTGSTGISKSKSSSTTNYVFGYGSLICPESRSITNPALAGKESLPVLIQDVERVWSARTKSGYTAMGVRFLKGAECTGILIGVDADELADLDRREGAYNRLPMYGFSTDECMY